MRLITLQIKQRVAEAGAASGGGTLRCLSAFVLLLVVLSGPAAAQDDQVEFLSGAKITGRVTSIDKDKRRVEFEAVIAGRKIDRTYTYDKIHAITYRGKRYILNEARPASASSGSGGSRTKPARASADALIAQAEGPPDWFEQTPLVYPQGLDLRWPEPAPKKWDNQKNVGQFIWDVLNPNESRWREGVKFMHFMLTQHAGDRDRRQRVMRGLASMYFRFFQDYPRAAYWWKQAGVSKGDRDAVGLAECYYRLGNKARARELLNTNQIGLNMIKLWGDMGETDKALQLAETYVRIGGPSPDAYLVAGDVCRLDQRLPKAIDYYRKAEAAARKAPNPKRAERVARRAQDNLQAIRLFELLDVKRVPDGAYQAASMGYEAPVEVEVSVQGGRIESVRITKHREKQFYSALRDVPAQIVAKQGVRGVDATSRATMTAEAIINATAKALAQGGPKQRQ